MIEDDVLRGVREAREAYARSHGFDVWAMAADLRAKNEQGDWPVVRLAPRRVPSVGLPRVGTRSTEAKSSGGHFGEA